MELRLKRIAKKETYTIGKLYIDGQYFCDTLEDTDRGLYSSMKLADIQRIKVPGQTAIPCGRYKVILSKSPRFRKILPEILNVNGFTGVRIHSGNTHKDTDGCLLLGENKAVGKVLNSKKTMDKFMAIISTVQSINLTVE